MGDLFSKLFGTAASEGIKGVTGMLGTQGFMDLLGSEGLKNMIAGGGALMDYNQTNKMMDFQMDKANNMERKSDIMFDRDMAKDDNRTGAFDEASNILGF